MTIIRNHYQMNHHRASSRGQTGAVLLLFLLILVTSASYSFLSQLNAATNLHTRQQATSRTLAEAKEALIGRAVTDANRPGSLPCPDGNNDGSADLFIGNECPSYTGRLPWRTLKMTEPKDSSGEHLWYVIQPTIRDHTVVEPINSEITGTLSVDAVSDIVAVIIAPESPVLAQVNRPSNTISDYLEDDNETTGDNIFTISPENGNDHLVFITRQELMGMVEKRVLAEVEDAINNYQATYTAFPWLSIFGDPSASAFRGTLNTWQGHLPFHWSGDTSGVVGRNPFQSTVGWIWHTDVGTATEFFSGTITADCLRNVDCSDGTFPQLAQVTTPLNDCTWTDKDTINCTPASSVLMSSITCDFGCGDFTCTREYLINIPAFTGTSSINNPTNTTTRLRDVTLNGSLPIQAAAVTITDRYIGDDPSTSCLTTTIQVIGNGVINFTGSTTGTLRSTGIQYDLDIDDGELPTWIVQNNWLDLVYVAYASGEALPGDTTAGQDCVSLATSCITVNNINGNATNNIRSVAIIAGEDLSGNRPSTNMEDYFELENKDFCETGCVSSPFDDVLEKTKLSTTYNDQTRIISMAP